MSNINALTAMAVSINYDRNLGKSQQTCMV
jgi:hypothetical protein